MTDPVLAARADDPLLASARNRIIPLGFRGSVCAVAINSHQGFSLLFHCELVKNGIPRRETEVLSTLRLSEQPGDREFELLLILGLDQETVHPVLNDLGNPVTPGSNHRFAAAHGFEQLVL